MLSGRRLDLADPSPLDIEIDDIAHGLARVARWNGQTSGDHAYSVAQHALLVCEIMVRLAPDLKKDGQLAGLLHDAPEYVIGDMISPFKAMMGGNYSDIEERLQASIHIRFGLPPKLPVGLKRLIKKADRISAFLEATQLAGFSFDEATQIFGQQDQIEAFDSKLTPVAPRDAQQEFLEAFERLKKD